MMTFNTVFVEGVLSGVCLLRVKLCLNVYISSASDQVVLKTFVDVIYSLFSQLGGQFSHLYFPLIKKVK